MQCKSFVTAILRRNLLRHILYRKRSDPIRPLPLLHARDRHALAQVTRNLRQGVPRVPGLCHQIPPQQPVHRQPGPRRLRELPPRVPQMALQTSQGHDRVVGLQRLHSDQERFDHTDSDHQFLPGSDPVEFDYREENRESSGRGEE